MKKKFLDFAGLSTFKQNILNIIQNHTSNNNIHMSSDEKTKLSGIAKNANNYTLPLASSSRGGVKIGYSQNGKNYPVQLDDEKMYVNVPWTDTNTTYSDFVKSGTGAKSGLVPSPGTTAGTTKYLREDGTWTVPPDNNTTYSNMTAATASAAGKAGLVPAPSAGSQTKYLRGDGTWQTPPDTNTTYSDMSGASSSTAGTHGLVPAPAKGSQNKYLRGDGTWQTPPDNNTTYSDMTAATASTAGTHGLVPAPAKGDQGKYLRGDGTWQTPPDTNTVYTHPTTSGNKHIPSGGSSGQILRWSSDGTATWGADNNTTYSEATSSKAGLLSATDKSRLSTLINFVSQSTEPTTQSTGDLWFKEE